MLGLSKSKEKDLYWALVIEPGWVQAGVWEIVEGKAQVISTSPLAAWEEDSELVGAADTALSSIIQTLPEETEGPSKTVFGLPPSWVEKGQIKEEFLAKIKNICVDLSLEPTGFVVLTEAIAHLVKREEGSPLNASIVGIAKDFLEISVFKLGNLMGTTSVARSVSIFDDVIEGLSRFAITEVLPSRIIIYDGREGELEEVKQSLIAADWESLEKVKFLHAPKVETLDPGNKVLATAFAGASEVAGVSVILEKKEEPPNIIEPKVSLTPQELGFVVGEDVASKPETPTQKPKNKPFLFIRKGKKTFLWGGISLVIILILFFVFWWFYPKADIKVYLTPRSFEEKTEITVNPSAGSLDLAKKTIRGQVLSTEASGEKTKSTTGTKKVGDRATGSIKIQNGTASILNLPTGTKIGSNNNLQFGLASSASISAALSPANPGTQIVDVVAADIGAEYNLAKDEVFKVGNYSKAEVDAVATGNFTGGSSRDISAVSSDDAENLLNSLTGELSDNAKNSLVEGLSSGTVFINDSLVATPSSKVFSSKVGDEASNLKLTLGLKVTALSVKKEDLISLAKLVLADSAPSGFSLGGDGLSFDFSGLKNIGKASLFNLKIVANFLPEVDLTLLSKEISGKNPLLVKERFSTIPGFSRAEIDINPKFPGSLGSLPRIPKNIKIELVSEK
jgi:hypothetical protein